ncbi:LamG domain-containing protein [Verrucosispora sp. SN26_14.1]|uniref:LamG domain-containing protein n=1 Tax=Verrucosispora sp. SN26_14.1 TaxID=2527879 RepID=UPI001375B226|nr:LamG domain-containing protein [Verrucosispora sp. SN26_14.1]
MRSEHPSPLDDDGARRADLPLSSAETAESDLTTPHDTPDIVEPRTPSATGERDADPTGTNPTETNPAGTDTAVTRPRRQRLRRALRSVPGLIGIVGGLVGIVAGIAALMPKEQPPDPFRHALFTEPFTSTVSDPDEVLARYALWVDTEDGDDDVWRSEIDTVQGLFRLSNRTDASRVRYIWINATNAGDRVPVEMTDRPVSVDVRIADRALSTSAAGLMYRWSGQPKRYYAFLLSGDGTYSFVARSDTLGFSYRLTERSEKITAEGWNSLAIVGKGDQLDLYINGTKVKTVDAVDFPDGTAGVIATSRGAFEFDNFRIYE